MLQGIEGDSETHCLSSNDVTVLPLLHDVLLVCSCCINQYSFSTMKAKMAAARVSPIPSVFSTSLSRL